MADRKLIYRRTYEGFVPANDDAAEFFGKVKLGQFVSLDGKQARNLKFHRMFFAMLRLISDNSNPHISEAAALHFAKLAAGVGDTVTDSRGETHFVPGSISFARMDQTQFETFVQTAIPPLVGRFMVGTAPDELIAEAMGLAA